MLPSFFLQRCSLQPQFAPGSGSTSQPLLLQSLAFSLGFCLQCGFLSLRATPPPPILCSLCPLHGSLAGGSEWGSKYLALPLFICLCPYVQECLCVQCLASLPSPPSPTQVPCLLLPPPQTAPTPATSPALLPGFNP